MSTLKAILIIGAVTVASVALVRLYFIVIYSQIGILLKMCALLTCIGTAIFLPLAVLIGVTSQTVALQTRNARVATMLVWATPLLVTAMFSQKSKKQKSATGGSET